jgi:hypothetical protein
LKADFFAGALALVRRATTAVSILRVVRRVGAAATRTPVNVDVSMRSGACAEVALEVARCRVWWARISGV